MVIRGSRCEGHLSVCRWEGGSVSHLGQLHFLYIYLPTHFLRLPATRLLQLVSRQRTAAGEHLTEEKYEAAMAAVQWQWQPPSSLWLAGKGSKDWES